MAFTTTYTGEILLLRYMLNNAPATNVRLHLYKNNQTPSRSDALSQYTESTAAGYSSFVLSGSQWTFATSGSTSSATFNRQSYTFTTGDSLYGYYITDNSNTQLIWAERFTGAPFQVPPTGGTIDVDPMIGLI